VPFSALDIAALVWFIAMMAAFELITTLSRFADSSLSAGVARHRRAWLAHMVERDQRHFDAILLASLSQSNAFFASTSVLGIGGLAAIMGSGDAARHMLERLPMVSETTPALWEIKILFLISILIYAFFKFAWAFRLSHYSAIMFGAMPPSADDDHAQERRRHGLYAARLLDLVGQHANSGLRSFYYAFAAIAWLFHPVLFMMAMTLVFAILIRREFVSRATRIISEAAPHAVRDEIYSSSAATKCDES
jgi:uncharacterized membrane protein